MESVKKRLAEFSLEAHDLYLSRAVPYLEAPPDPLNFYRDWIAPNKPCIIRNAFSHWPALSRWTPEYLREKVGSKVISVAVTPNGYADAVNGDRFVMPEERCMSFSSVLDILQRKVHKDHYENLYCVISGEKNFILLPPTDRPFIPYGVYQPAVYRQRGDGEFEIVDQSDAEKVPWIPLDPLDPDLERYPGYGAARPLRCSVKAGEMLYLPSLWFHHVTQSHGAIAVHKDHYENLYCVISGEKNFILLPPTDRPFIPYGVYQPAVYRQRGDGEFEIVDQSDAEKVPWIPLDPLDPDLERYPGYGAARPLRCSVKAGEMLYLPSLWFHHVTQSHGAIAVNFWYDMEYDIKYNYYQLLETLSEVTGGST